MTDRVFGLTVVLSEELRDDDPQLLATIAAIKQMRGVVQVTPQVANIMYYSVVERVRGQFIQGIGEWVRDYLSTGDIVPGRPPKPPPGREGR